MVDKSDVVAKALAKKIGCKKTVGGGSVSCLKGDVYYLYTITNWSNQDSHISINFIWEEFKRNSYEQIN